MIAWDSMFMEICATVAKRSKDTTQVGACVVDRTDSLVSVGFNGPPRCAHDASVPKERPAKYDWVIHAELNAILFALAARGEYMLKNCTLYTNATICSKCMLVAAHVGIGKIVCGSVKPHMCDESDVAVMRAIAAQCGVEVTSLPSP